MAKKPTSSYVAQPTDRPTKRSRRHDDRTNGTQKGRRSKVSALPSAASPDVAVVRKAPLSNKEDVDKRGKPFYPYAMFHDTVMSLVVVCVIVALA